MPSLSAAIVCKNNRATLERTLDSLAPIVNAEILAVDSGSTDGTLELLARFNARVLRTHWRGHVATKQLALELASQTPEGAPRGADHWVLSIDSDESVEPELARAIRAAIERDDPAIAGYRVRRVVYYRDQPLNHVWQPEWRLRLVRAGAARWGGLDPHDKLELTRGAASDLAGVLRHDSIGTFGEFFEKQMVHARTMARSMAREGRRGSVLKLCTSPAGAFLKQVVLKSAWRDGWPGWLAAASTAAATLAKHAALIELTHTPAATEQRPDSGQAPG